MTSTLGGSRGTVSFQNLYTTGLAKFFLSTNHNPDLINDDYTMSGVNECILATSHTALANMKYGLRYDV